MTPDPPTKRARTNTTAATAAAPVVSVALAFPPRTTHLHQHHERTLVAGASTVQPRPRPLFGIETLPAALLAVVCDYLTLRFKATVLTAVSRTLYDALDVDCFRGGVWNFSLAPSLPLFAKLSKISRFIVNDASMGGSTAYLLAKVLAGLGARPHTIALTTRVTDQFLDLMRVIPQCCSNLQTFELHTSRDYSLALDFTDVVTPSLRTFHCPELRSLCMDNVTGLKQFLHRTPSITDINMLAPPSTERLNDPTFLPNLRVAMFREGGDGSETIHALTKTVIDERTGTVRPIERLGKFSRLSAPVLADVLSMTTLKTFEFEFFRFTDWNAAIRSLRMSNTPILASIETVTMKPGYLAEPNHSDVNQFVTSMTQQPQTLRSLRIIEEHASFKTFTGSQMKSLGAHTQLRMLALDQCNKELIDGVLSQCDASQWPMLRSLAIALTSQQISEKAKWRRFLSRVSPSLTDLSVFFGDSVKSVRSLDAIVAVGQYCPNLEHLRFRFPNRHQRDIICEDLPLAVQQRLPRMGVAFTRLKSLMLMCEDWHNGSPLTDSIWKLIPEIYRHAPLHYICVPSAWRLSALSVARLEYFTHLRIIAGRSQQLSHFALDSFAAPAIERLYQRHTETIEVEVVSGRDEINDLLCHDQQLQSWHWQQRWAQRVRATDDRKLRIFREPPDGHSSFFAAVRAVLSDDEVAELDAWLAQMTSRNSLLELQC